MRRTLSALVVAASLGLGGPALAAGEAMPPVPNHAFSFDGLFGTVDRASAQRGFLVYKQVCANCHAMRLLSYRNLQAIGLSEAEVRAIAAEITVNDGPNDAGEMFERPARLSDRFRSPHPNEAAARAANNGAHPPDLSVITKARDRGADYIRALLLGYEDPPPGVQMGDGMNYNKWFAGHQIAMAQPLYPDSVDYPDGTSATLDQLATDVTTFLAWAAEPELEARKSMGVRVLVFLTILGGLAYAVKRRVWADLH